ncbi:hypothetical protein BDV25DRAFT_67183 [Aspergillus avenaceus]|uniref:IgE-binding protein n=1 Tax=Aspergillus avenaceus TaxID=36643 RepID=A0A5N6U1A0_ASPAV|nr:hypothetical protein BDV25DRAFT_67183 [Aspergillus avenaceus]
MKLSAVSSFLLPLLAAAAEPTPFGVMSSHSASPVHLLPMNAAGQKFWLGGETSSYCPISSGCPDGKYTVFAAGGGALDVVVPGGQQVYVDEDGALSFTQAHSAYIPPGSSLGPFEHKPGKPFGYYSFNGWGATGFMACPTEDSRWQVFAAIHNATVPQGNVNDCIGFSALAVPSNATAGAWQYA